MVHKKDLDLMNNQPFKPRMIFKVDDVKYKRHPVYDLYAASKDGRIININKKIPRYGHMILKHWIL